MRPLLKTPCIVKPNPVWQADVAEGLRRERRTQQHIAGEFGISKATVSRVFRRRGLRRNSRACNRLGIKHFRTTPYTP